MKRTLFVYMYRKFVGILEQDAHGKITFHYDTAWLQDDKSVSLSHSLPLRPQIFSPKECQGFFSGLLPEEEQRKILAGNLGVSERNYFSLLEKIGGECAGAVQFFHEGQSFPVQENLYRDLSVEELKQDLERLPRVPFLAGDQDVRLSLAGAQNKIVVHMAKGKIGIPLCGSPSSVILKPANQRFPGLIYNEAFCMQLAKRVGLPVADVTLGSVAGMDYLRIDRYDRRLYPEDGEVWPRVERLHQEDFCQALGLPPEIKYQTEGGPSLTQCFTLLRETSSIPALDIKTLLDGVLFNVLIGNNDAHGKNFSLLYNKDSDSGQKVHLAPFYDLVSTVFYPELTSKMAMKIGEKYDSSRIMHRDFEKFAEEAKLSKAIVNKRGAELAQAVLRNIGEIRIAHQTIPDLIGIIQKRCHRAFEIFQTGKKQSDT